MISRLTVSLVVTFILLISFSRWKIWLGVLVGSLTFGLINYDVPLFLEIVQQTFFSVRNWLLVIAVGLIPVLGAIMRESTNLAEILDSLKQHKKLYLIFTPAIFGLLPIPGGALLSCPLLKGFDEKITPDHSVAINIWFRHLPVIIYPLSNSLIIGSQLAGISITKAILSMFPIMAIMFVTGYIFLLKNVKNDSLVPGTITKRVSKRKLTGTLVVFLTAPVLHIVLSTTILKTMEQLSFFISMVIGVSLAAFTNKLSLKKFFKVLSTSKFEQFSLLILFLLLFLNMMRQYEDFGSLFVNFHPPLLLMGLFGFLLSYLSGRIEIALSLVYPLIFTIYGITTFSGALFAYIYFSLFAGYLLSPIHPCMAFSVEYFQTSYRKVLMSLAPLLIPAFLYAILLVLI